MADRLTFGTAGLRGPLGEGPLCMNVEQVELAAMAIAQWLPANSTLIIGRDARYGSEDFAHVTARVLTEVGHIPRLFSRPVPTPVIPFLIGASDATAGVVVTASHNPATDNGYKVYSADGGQLMPTDASMIEATMASLPWPESVDTRLPSGLEDLGAEQIDAYVAFVADAVGNTGQAPGVTVAYSAMHGVGGDLFTTVLEQVGHNVHSVEDQHDPNPDFPTAAFPNPEEPGTLDLVMALADEVDADIVLANDPDADRLAVAVRRTSGWERLTGDQIGVLLAWWTLESTERPCTVASSIVSSTLLAKLAAARGAEHASTLTGFKWLARAGSPEAPLAFAYEEALGYSVIPTIRDKDGISAGLAFANLVALLKADSRTVDDLLGELAEEFGHHLTAQVSIRFDGSDSMAQLADVMSQLRSERPQAIGDMAVVEHIDLAEPDSGSAPQPVGRPALPPSNVLIFNLDGGRLIVRPSGTEPKIKAYLEVIDTDPTAAQTVLDSLRSATGELLG